MHLLDIRTLLFADALVGFSLACVVWVSRRGPDGAVLPAARLWALSERHTPGRVLVWVRDSITARWLTSLLSERGATVGVRVLEAGRVRASGTGGVRGPPRGVAGEGYPPPRRGANGAAGLSPAAWRAQVGSMDQTQAPRGPTCS